MFLQHGQNNSKRRKMSKLHKFSNGYQRQKITSKNLPQSTINQKVSLQNSKFNLKQYDYCWIQIEFKWQKNKSNNEWMVGIFITQYMYVASFKRRISEPYNLKVLYGKI